MRRKKKTKEPVWWFDKKLLSCVESPQTYTHEIEIKNTHKHTEDAFAQITYSFLVLILFFFNLKAQCQDSQCHCEDSPPPHSALSQQSCSIDGGNGNAGPGIMSDDYSRRPSIDRLDSPQVICKSNINGWIGIFFSISFSIYLLN